jgi:phosphoribosylanthranilate isomerase
VTLVKVCGLARVEDVRLAVELGAWALGFVLTESPRQVSPAHAGELIAGVKAGCADEQAPITVAVVAAEPAVWIAAAAAEAGADAVQLSAGADGPTVTTVRKAAARLRRRPLVIAAADTPDAALADWVLLDARTAGAYGGTGRTLDWHALAADPPAPRHRLVLAGGLRPPNVAQAVHALLPAAVDVSSGVESSPGRKDHTRLRDFFAAVEQADREDTVNAGPQDGDRGRPAHLRRTSG